MKITPNKKYYQPVQYLAFTDIIINLFIFFFLSFSLVYTFNPLHRSIIPVKLPIVKSVDYQKEEVIQLTITKEGKIYVGKSEVRLKDLEFYLSSLLMRKTDRVVAIRADKSVNYGLVASVLDKSKLAGAKKLALAVEKKK